MKISITPLKSLVKIVVRDGSETILTAKTTSKNPNEVAIKLNLILKLYDPRFALIREDEDLFFVLKLVVGTETIPALRDIRFSINETLRPQFEGCWFILESTTTLF